MTEDDPVKILKNVFELCQTEKGKQLFQRVNETARVAMGVQGVLEYCNELRLFSRSISAEEQQSICSIIWHCMKFAKHDDVIKYVESIGECYYSEEEEKGLGNC